MWRGSEREFRVLGPTLLVGWSKSTIDSFENSEFIGGGEGWFSAQHFIEDAPADSCVWKSHLDREFVLGGKSQHFSQTKGMMHEHSQRPVPWTCGVDCYPTLQRSAAIVYSLAPSKSSGGLYHRVTTRLVRVTSKAALS